MMATQTELAGPDLAAMAARQPALGLAPLLRAVRAGQDLTPLTQSLVARAQQHGDVDALLDLSLVLQLKFEKPSALQVQKLALEQRRLFHLQSATTEPPPLRLLVLKAPGCLMANTPLECLIEGADIAADVLYLDGGPLPPSSLPPHDLIFVAACDSNENARALAQIAQLTRPATVPVINPPANVALTGREAAYSRLGHLPGIRMAHTVRFERAELTAAAAGAFDLAGRVEGDYPFIVRPVGSHAGQGLVKIDDPAALGAYLATEPAAQFYVAPFIDYRGADGLYRKFRIVLIAGRPFLCHLGISADWMVHYPYPEMTAHPERRAEEARAMAEFDGGFAARHGEAMRLIAARTGLDYVGFDGAETADGRLIIFEIATGMVVHDTDDPAVFPYKLPQMRRVFAAFQAMLRERAGAAC